MCVMWMCACVQTTTTFIWFLQTLGMGSKYSGGKISRRPRMPLTMELWGVHRYSCHTLPKHNFPAHFVNSQHNYFLLPIFFNPSVNFYIISWMFLDRFKHWGFISFRSVNFLAWLGHSSLAGCGCAASISMQLHQFANCRHTKDPHCNQSAISQHTTKAHIVIILPPVKEINYTHWNYYFVNGKHTKNTHYSSICLSSIKTPFVQSVNRNERFETRVLACCKDRQGLLSTCLT